MGHSNIKLTVGLPMYQSKYIGWIALESLIRQTNVDFKWELIVAEEQKHHIFGEEKLMSYSQSLERVGCVRIKYIPLKEWIPLSRKWTLIAEQSSDSDFFLLQAADCYSSHKRLKNTYELSRNGCDWIQTQFHAMYNLASNHFYIYDVLSIKRKSKAIPVGGDMALKTSLMKQMPKANKKKGIDGWLLSSARDMKKGSFSLSWDKSDSWQYSLNVHGLNNISNRKFKKNPKRYRKAEHLRKNIPQDVMNRLYESKKYLNLVKRITEK